MFAESRPEVIEDMRQAADELRAELAGELVTFVVNRNINVSNICTVGCAFCGFGVGKRSPDAYEHSRADFVRRIHDALDFGATEICMQSGIHPDWGLEDYLGWLRAGQGDRAAAPPARVQPDGDRPHVRRHRAAAARGLRAAARRRPGLASPAPPPRSCTTACASASRPNKLPVGALGGDHHRRPRGRAALDRDRDVRPHRDAGRAGRAHARRAHAAGAHRRLHRVRAAVVHPVPDAARPHARHRRDLARGEPQAHGGLPARARARRSRRCRRAG